jgi:hypothetical protein
MQEMKNPVIGLFTQRLDAENALEELKKAGIPKGDISVVAPEGVMGKTMGPQEKTGGAMGAVGGAAVGGLGGLLAGIGAIVIPGIGPVIAIGTIAAALASTAVGAAIGAVAGGLVGVLVGLGLPESEARAYAEGVKSGGILVVVEAGPEKAIVASSIMQRMHARTVPVPTV